MERDKIDETWKERLAEREITPSTQAWDKLSFQLDQHNKTNNKQKYRLFLYIAACLVLGGYLVAQFVWQEQSVVAPTVLDNLPTQTVVDGNVNNKKNEEPEEQVETVFTHEKKEGKIFVPKMTPKTTSKLNNTNTKLAKNNIEEDTINSLKLEGLQEIFIEPVVNKSSKKIIVNSDDLLNQVESEIELEYRESVIKKIYDKTKQVIVERTK